jgi:hypothetical protein
MMITVVLMEWTKQIPASTIIKIIHRLLPLIA